MVPSRGPQVLQLSLGGLHVIEFVAFENRQGFF